MARGQNTPIYPKATATRRAAQAWITFLVLLGLFLRLYLLGHQELRGDEAYEYFLSILQLPVLVRQAISFQIPHPIASHVLEHFAILLFGHSEFAIRLPSALAGTATVPVIYKLGKELRLSERASLFAAFFATISSYLIWHSQDARMYSEVLLFTAISFWFMERALTNGGTTNWLVYILSASVSIYTHYFAGFIIIAQNFFFLLLLPFDHRHRRNFYRWALSQFFVLILYIPWLPVALKIVTHYKGAEERAVLTEAWWRVASAFAVGVTLPSNTREICAVLAIGVIAIGAAALWGRKERSGKRAAALLLIYLLVPVLLSIVSAFRRPIFTERYFIAALPPFYLLLGTAFGASVPKRLPRFDKSSFSLIASVVALLLLGTLVYGDIASLHSYYYDPKYSKTRGWRDLAQFFTKISSGFNEKEVLIVQNYPDPTMWYYYRGKVHHLVLPPSKDDLKGTQSIVDKLTTSEIVRIIFPMQRSPAWDSNELVENVLQQHFPLIGVKHVGVWPVEVYDRPDGWINTPTAKFSNGISLYRASVHPKSLLPGGVLAVHLMWTIDPDAHIADGNKIFIHLELPSGKVIAQTDRTFGPNEAMNGITSYGVWLPDKLPPGDYRLVLGFYNIKQAGFPRVRTAEGQDHVELLQFHYGGN